jgi:hypothetical protein
MTKVNARAERAGAALYKWIFYMGASVVGYIIMKDTPVLPKSVGGSGSIEGIFEGMPYQKQDPYFLEYSLVLMGYFLEDFAHHLFVKERTSDFWEMNLHHLMTVTLYGGMIL